MIIRTLRSARAVMRRGEGGSLPLRRTSPNGLRPLPLALTDSKRDGKSGRNTMRNHSSEAEHPSGLDCGQLQCSVRAAHRAAATASSDSLQRFIVTRCCYAYSAFEHPARRRQDTGLNGHVSLRLFECHTIPH
jgi:hypothetical protein